MEVEIKCRVDEKDNTTPPSVSLGIIEFDPPRTWAVRKIEIRDSIMSHVDIGKRWSTSKMYLCDIIGALVDAAQRLNHVDVVRSRKDEFDIPPEYIGTRWDIAALTQSEYDVLWREFQRQPCYSDRLESLPLTGTSMMELKHLCYQKGISMEWGEQSLLPFA
jgi:hypothetical protein